MPATLISAWRYWSEARSASDAWLTRIAVNKSLDEHRRRRRKPLTSIDHAVAGGCPEPGSHDGTPELAALDGELQQELEHALSLLQLGQRRALILHDVQGYTYAEIALATSASVGTVKSRIFRGRRALREILRTGATTEAARAAPRLRGSPPTVTQADTEALWREAV